MLLLLSLVLGTAQLCHASAEIEIRSLVPIMVSIDGAKPKLAGPFLHRSVGLEPGSASLRVTGLFGKLLAEETWTLHDWVTHQGRVRGGTLTLEGSHRSPGAPMRIDTSPPIPPDNPVAEAQKANLRFVRTEGPAIQIWIDDLPAQDLLAGAVATQISLEEGTYFIEIFASESGDRLHRGLLTVEPGQELDFQLDPQRGHAALDAWKPLLGRKDTHP